MWEEIQSRHLKEARTNFEGERLLEESSGVNFQRLKGRAY